MSGGPLTLVLATRNAHKISEISAMLVDHNIVVLGLDSAPDMPDDLPEDGDNFVDNALQKARFVAAAAGLPALADDSGLEVEALGWGPGVYSKRYSVAGTDEANNQKLLAELGERPSRRARYRCVLALALPDGKEASVDGLCEGHIGYEHLGEGGFGYDPLFWPDDAPGRTMAELTQAQKNAISHRGRALRRLGELLDATGLG